MTKVSILFIMSGILHLASAASAQTPSPLSLPEPAALLPLLPPEQQGEGAPSETEFKPDEEGAVPDFASSYSDDEPEASSLQDAQPMHSILVDPKAEPLIPVELPPISSSSRAPSDALSNREPDLSEEGASLRQLSYQEESETASSESDPTSLLAEAFSKSIAPEGQPLSLYDALENRLDHTQRAETITAYWRLSHHLAAQGWAMERWQYLHDLAPPTDLIDQQRLAARVDRAEALWRKLEINAIEAQHTLHRSAMFAAQTPLPIPSDAPLVIAYQTRFDTLFAEREAPSLLAQINQTMPYRLALIESRASAIEKASIALDSQLAAYQEGRLSVDAIFNAIDLLGSEQEAFLDDVHTYNLDIATYALGVAMVDIDRDSLVAMLIEYDPPERPVFAANDTNQAVLISPVRSTNAWETNQGYPSPSHHPFLPAGGGVPTLAGNPQPERATLSTSAAQHSLTPQAETQNSGTVRIPSELPSGVELLPPSEHVEQSSFREIRPLQESSNPPLDLYEARPESSLTTERELSPDASQRESLSTEVILNSNQEDGMRSILIR